MKKILAIFCLLILVFSSCESKEEKAERMHREEQRRIEIENIQKAREEQKAIELENARKAKEKRIAEEKEARKIALEKKRIRDKYINNTLTNGATPYAYCYGGNSSCSSNYCSQIKVTTPYSSDVLVILKKNDEVYRHAYVKAGRTYTFEIPNGSYQPFFYYGKGWNPNKEMKRTSCGILKGGFVADEIYSKDNPQSINNAILSYELILQQNGNFQTKGSSKEELF